MTNCEMLIKSLKYFSNEGEDPFDDGGAGVESIIAYNINCPHHYCGHPCDHEKYPFDTLKVCGPCIQEWLMQEVGE